MAPERLPFLTSTLNTLGMSAETLRSMFDKSATSSEIMRKQAAAAKDVDASKIDVDELMKSRIPLMKGVADNVGDMTRRLDEAAQLLAGSSRDIVKASQEWHNYIVEMVGARKQAALLKAQLEYIRMQFSEQQSKEATHRAEMKL